MSWLEGDLREPGGESSLERLVAGMSHRGRPPTPDPETLAPIASVTLYWLLVSFRSWIHRRIESLAVLDETTVRRIVSFEYSVPQRLPDIGEVSGSDVPFLPLTYLAKGPIRGANITDEEGELVPVLNRRENGAVSAGILVALAEEIMHDTVSDSLRDAFRELVTLEPPKAQDWLRRLQRWPERSVRDLMRNSSFDRLVRQLVDDFVLLVPRRVGLGVRASIALSYEEFLERQEVSVWQRASVALAWRPRTLRVEAPAVADSDSYHFEVEAPADVEIVAAYLATELDNGPGPSVHDETALRAHLYVSGLPQGARGTVSVYFRAAPPAFFWAALATTVLSFVLLLGGRFALGHLVDEVEAATTMLVFVPGLLAAFVGRPGEHALVTPMLTGVRSFVILSGGCAIAAAALLVAGVHGETLATLWSALGVVAFVAMLAVAISTARVFERLGWI